MRTTDMAIRRFRQLGKVRAWPEWPAAMDRLRELGCTEDQLVQIRRGVEEVVFRGSVGSEDSDVVWHVAQVLSVLIHQGYEVLDLYDKPASESRWSRDPLDPRRYQVYCLGGLLDG